MRRIAWLLAPLCAAPVCAAGHGPALAREPGRLVDPFVGTLADFGQLNPAAVAPYGMVQLGPDTSPANHAGYDYAADRLIGFSHSRGGGVGCGGAGGDMLVMLEYAGAARAARIDKRSERAHAGYYSVRYGSGIVAELTATRGSGIIRFTLPRAGRVTLSADPNHSYSKRLSARWESGNWNDLRASLSAGTVCDVGAYHIHSASELSRNGRRVDAPVLLDASGRASLELRVDAGDIIELRTGLSSVDAEAAARVRAAELGGRRFDIVARETLRNWNHELHRVRIDASREEQALFYTALFRVMQSPVAIADPDGRFRGSDGRIHYVPAGRQRYTGWALWDNYRTQMPLLALLDPARAADIARSLVSLYAEGKQRWATKQEPFLSVRTEHAGVALLDFRRKGIDGFDARAALDHMIAESPTLARRTPDEQIEAAYDDWAIAQLAGDIGDAGAARRFGAQALGYRSMWRSVFEDLGADADVVKARGLYQGTLWQYRWAPVFDLPWLARTLGPDRFDAELDAFFARGLFNMTNQPDIHAPFLHAWRGRPDKSEAIVRQILTQPIDHHYTNAAKRAAPWHGRSFNLAPQGFADGMDDDAGAMTAWYVFSVLGLYPLVPGEPWYVLSTPAYREARILVPGAKAITIRRTGSRGGSGIENISFDHAPLRSNRVEHRRLVEGGLLLFETIASQAADSRTSETGR
ncbi:glycosyl hydrolase family 92 [Sphingomonas oleivorans]|uniref:Glycosyl hydrolase family 92 n=2 Tax=Sphingomonas oleivorans TaxID=1735121 RepID=A0A2T5G0E1_9SPHN|nr:glycosyl hydrolase family 92 [Sphingomonas oleivorans]